MIQNLEISSHLDEAFELLRVCYDNQPSGQPMGGTWTRGLLKGELTEGTGIGKFCDRGYLRALVLFRRQPEGIDISLVATSPKHRRQGFMTDLLENLKSSLKPGQNLWIDVHEANNSAISFYKRQNFKEVGLRKSYYRDGGDALLWSWKP